MPTFEGLPHMGEGLGGHVRMTQEVMRRTQQLLAAVAADPDEVRIGVGNRAVQIGGRKDVGIKGDVYISPGNREIDLHGKRAQRVRGVGRASTLSARKSKTLI